MEPPKNINRPFFAYGIFKPGQLGFCQLKDFVSEIRKSIQVPGILMIRDGLPIIDQGANGYVEGSILVFAGSIADKAYDRISSLEPDKHYRWGEAKINNITANMLLGKHPKKGSVLCESKEWNGWDDPLFTSALIVVEETLNSEKQFNWDLKPLFRLQMAYLLLWSSIERYVSLRYHLGDKVMEKVKQLSGETGFKDGLLKHVSERREVFRADRPEKKLVLDPQASQKSLDYYYQIRSNITHRGKGIVRDHDIVLKSLGELLQIFRDVLESAKNEAKAKI
jgi:hypothetical protein